MQKLAGLITESEYNEKINEADATGLRVEWTPEYNSLMKIRDLTYHEKGLSNKFEMINGEKVKEIIGYFYDEDDDEDYDIIGYIKAGKDEDIESYSDDELDDAFMKALGGDVE
tara:strand:- start:1715 stop:2053 length:339 start_codon:yes stop_codon:yes gene_type:complete